LLTDGGVPIQRQTNAYTAAELGHHGTGPPLPFIDEAIQFIVYSRPGISQTRRNAVDNFGDGATTGTYKHHVPYNVILQGIRDECEGETRETIVDWLENSVEAVGTDPATFGVNPSAHRAAFDTWLDLAISAIADWPENIFRGPSGGDHGGTAIDVPTAPSLGLTTRLTGAVNTLTGLRYWP
jgi:hypothetical protein